MALQQDKPKGLFKASVKQASLLCAHSSSSDQGSDYVNVLQRQICTTDWKHMPGLQEYTPFDSVSVLALVSYGQWPR